MHHITSFKKPYILLYHIDYGGIGADRDLRWKIAHGGDDVMAIVDLTQFHCDGISDKCDIDPAAHCCPTISEGK